MALALIYDRALREVQTLDTVSGVRTTLGAAISGADTTNSFPMRSQNLVAVFRGNPYLLYRQNTGAVALAVYQSGSWGAVAGFGTVVAGSGSITPVALQVTNGNLVAVISRSGSAGIDGLIARKSTDGATWSAAVTVNNPLAYQPAVSNAGHSVVWKGVVFTAEHAGLNHYNVGTDAWGAFDEGDDSAINGEKVTQGCFAYWNDGLYFLLPTVSTLQTPKLYQLDPDWEPGAPTSPAWLRVTTTIFPSAGALTPGNDNGTYALFVNKQGVLSAAYSGNLQTRLVTIVDQGAGLQVQDVTATALSATVAAKLDLGWSFYADDRRRLNELHYLLVRDITAVPTQVILFSWDGLGELTPVDTLTDASGVDFMAQNDERGDFRTFTDLQPAAFITGYSAPFDGRTQLDYTVRDALSRPVDVFGEYTLDKQNWLPMTQGDGDSGSASLPSSPAGIAYTFYWDAFQDLLGTYPYVDVRLIVRVSGP